MASRSTSTAEPEVSGRFTHAHHARHHIGDETDSAAPTWGKEWSNVRVRRASAYGTLDALGKEDVEYTSVPNGNRVLAWCVMALGTTVVPATAAVGSVGDGAHRMNVVCNYRHSWQRRTDEAKLGQFSLDSLTEVTTSGADYHTNAKVEDWQDEFNEVVAVEDGAMGYGSIAPNHYTIEAAKHFVKRLIAVDAPLPEVAVAADGEIGLLWAKRSGDVDVVFNNGRMTYLVERDGSFVARGSQEYSAHSSPIPSEVFGAVVADD